MEWWVLGIPAGFLAALILLERLLCALFPNWANKPDPWEEDAKQ